MIGAVVTAAGRSRRMGTQKLLLPFGRTTVIGHVVDQLLHSVVDRIYVVVGHQPDRIITELSGRAVSIVTNTDHDRGMLSSIRCGLRALPPECAAILVALGDQPAVTAELVDAMVESFAKVNRRIVVPTHGGRRGHPLLFSADYRQEILTRYDAPGLRGLLRAHADDLFELPVATPAVLSDINYPEDYRRARAALKRNPEAKETSPHG